MVSVTISRMHKKSRSYVFAAAQSLSPGMTELWLIARYPLVLCWFCLTAQISYALYSAYMQPLYSCLQPFTLSAISYKLTGRFMAEPYLKNRTRFTSSLDNPLVPRFSELARVTRIPKSRLLDEAITDLLIKHGMTVPDDNKQTETD